MNVSVEEKSSVQQQQAVVGGSGNDPLPNPDTEDKNEQDVKVVNSEENGAEAKTKDSKEADNGNDKQATDTKGTGVETHKEEPSEEDLKSMSVRQYLEHTGTGLHDGVFNQRSVVKVVV